MLGWLLLAFFPLAVSGFGGHSESDDTPANPTPSDMPDDDEDDGQILDEDVSPVDTLGTGTYDPFGADEDQIYVGTDAANSFDGAETRDEIHARGGNDSIKGGDGDDWIDGQGGDDLISGDGGSDVLVGNVGDDILRGGAGDDILGRYSAPERGTDPAVWREMAIWKGGQQISGSVESGNDQLYGEDGDDMIFAGAGDDMADGGTGDDVLLGEWGEDSLWGGDGNDRLAGGADNDSVDGGNGDDILLGNSGDDTLSGGDGNDLLGSYRGVSADGRFDVADGNVYGSLNEAGDDLLDGGAGNDTLYGGDGNDKLSGGIGNDVLLGGDGDDTLSGDAGNDVLVSGEGDNLLDGGSGDDFLTVADHDGENTLHGGDGDDIVSGQFHAENLYERSLITNSATAHLFGDAGDDTLLVGINDDAEGGEGADRFVFNPQDAYRLNADEFATQYKPATVTDFTKGEDVLVVHMYVNLYGQPDESVIDVIDLPDGNGSAITADGTTIGVIEGVTGLTLDDLVIAYQGSEAADIGPSTLESGGGGTISGRFYASLD